jgi:hypothetical protein
MTNKEKLHCAERELAFRFRVYDRLVVKGRMTREQQEREIELMSEIVADYRALASADEPEFAMFIETRKTTEQRGAQAAGTTFMKTLASALLMEGRITPNTARMMLGQIPADENVMKLHPHPLMQEGLDL